MHVFQHALRGYCRTSGGVFKIIYSQWLVCEFLHLIGGRVKDISEFSAKSLRANFSQISRGFE